MPQIAGEMVALHLPHRRSLESPQPHLGLIPGGEVAVNSAPRAIILRCAHPSRCPAHGRKRMDGSGEETCGLHDARPQGGLNSIPTRTRLSLNVHVSPRGTGRVLSFPQGPGALKPGPEPPGAQQGHVQGSEKPLVLLSPGPAVGPSRGGCAMPHAATLSDPFTTTGGATSSYSAFKAYLLCKAPP